MPAHTLGESIEGARISGNSRDPVRFQRSEKVNGIKYHLFKAAFNVHAEIDAALPSTSPPINKNALTNLGETLGCDSAIISRPLKTVKEAVITC